MSYADAYKLAAEKVDMAAKFFLGREEVGNLIVYGLSYDNLVGRDHDELDSILEAQEDRYKAWLQDPFFDRKRVRIIFHGDLKLLLEHLPPSYIEVMQELEDKTQAHEWKRLFILIGHSGKREVQRQRPADFLQQVREVGRPIPPNIDLVLRTGGGARLSDALLPQTAYAEFYFIEKFITEIDSKDLSMALDALRATIRKFGT